jgi:hypothetical protein
VLADAAGAAPALGHRRAQDRGRRLRGILREEFRLRDGEVAVLLTQSKKARSAVVFCVTVFLVPA